MCGSDTDLKGNHGCRAARLGHRYVVPPTKVPVGMLHSGDACSVAVSVCLQSCSCLM